MDKNYKVKNGNKPFNFSIIFFNDINANDIKSETLKFKFISIYIGNDEEIPNLISLLNDYLDSTKYELLIGHQIISDLYTFYNYSTIYNNIRIDQIKIWISLFKNRKENKRIFDTRFDIKNFLKTKSRRLVNVCDDMKIINQLDLYHQPELNKSLTYLQNEYAKTKDDSIREKLSVMNLRHNLSCVLVYTLYQNNIRLKKRRNINIILKKKFKKILFLY